MKLYWLAVLECLSVQLVMGYPFADTTQATVVITKSDDTSTEPEVAATTEAATEEPVLPIKLTEMDVNSVVSLRYAHTAVVARVKNPAKRAQEANFRVLLPETAFISGFIMTLDGKSYKAYVKEKKEAKQIYDQAVSQGLGAAYVTAKARDSNQFVVSVNVEPSSTAVFNLTYEELLVRRNGVYNHAINLHPGALVPKLTVTVHIKEVQKITDLRVPEIRTGNEIDAKKDDAQNTKAVIERGHDDREATITFTPDLDEQQRLMRIYADKSKQSVSNTHSVLGQFVVQYDVDRPMDGEILINDGYFVHFFAPTLLPPLNKYVVFVLDTSYSMMDRKMNQVREAMHAILSDLNPGDFFSIVDFESSVNVRDLKEADRRSGSSSYSGYRPKPELVAPYPATAENIAKAKIVVSNLYASGATDIAGALDVAVQLIHKRTEWGKKPAPANDTATTDPTTSTTETTADAEHVDVLDAEKMKSLEPIIIFLTDGDPTEGETNPTTIINRLTEKNYGEDKATIFSLAFGEDADREFLRKLSLRNDGFMRHIYEAADAALQLQDFYRQVSSPLLADVKFIYPEDQVNEGSVTKNKFKTFYSGSEVVVAGKINDDVMEITPQILGLCKVEIGFGKKRYEKLHKAPVPTKRLEYLPLERLWSYLTIKQLLDATDASDGGDDSKENNPEKKALALALKYEFVTPLTSLVVVKPNSTVAVAAESAEKPKNQPYHSFFARSPFSSTRYNIHAPLDLSTSYLRSPVMYFQAPYDLHHGYSGLSSYYGSPYRFFRRPSYANYYGMDLDDEFESSDLLSRLFPRQDLISTTTTTPTSTTEITKPVVRLIDAYHLQDFSWTESLLNATADALVLRVNETDHFLKLSKNADAPRAPGGDTACEASTSGAAQRGVCVYLTRCDAAKHITADSYKSTFCVVDGYAGVCCSQTKTDLAAEQTQ